MRENKKNRARKAQQEDPGPETSYAKNDAAEPSLGHETHPHDVNDADVEKYATMPLTEIQKELHRHGIDPKKTIDAVTQLVDAKLKEWAAARRRVLHGHPKVIPGRHRRHLHVCRRKLHRKLVTRGVPKGTTIMGGASD